MTDENFNRTLSRLATVQILYALDSKSGLAKNNLNIEKEIRDTEKYYKDLQNKNKSHNDLNVKFLKRLVNLTVQNVSKIDLLIDSNLNRNETSAKINNLLKTILRSGICEILHFKTPPKVIIDEYVKLTKDFFDAEEAGFINALLDRISKEV